MSHLDERVSIVSLNYDDCIPTFIDKIGCFQHCFDNLDDHTYYKNALNVKRFFAESKVMYFPHGHLRFIFNDRENVTYESDIHEAESMRWDGVFNNRTLVVTKNPFCYDFNTFITTGQTKDNALNNMPYAVYYQKLAVDFLTSNLVILVGYSLNDHHFNRLLKSFLHRAKPIKSL